LTSLQEEFRENIQKVGLKYHNLLDFINKKITDGSYLNGEQLLESEYREALMSLEEDGYINLIGHKKAPTIRFCPNE
jgi:hypothetical protein